MSIKHPILPPQWLIDQWKHGPDGFSVCIINAARWGADQELEACCEHIKKWFVNPQYRVEELQVARRPQPSLKEQALKALDCIEADFNTVGDRCDAIRRALKTLKD